MKGEIQRLAELLNNEAQRADPEVDLRGPTSRLRGRPRRTTALRRHQLDADGFVGPPG
jgi:hypothetical protein